MKTNIRLSLIVLFCFLSESVFSQVLSNGTTSPGVTAENPFLDASTYFDSSVSSNNEGKGLVFPQTDLTTWFFLINSLDGATFPSAFNGMIVYNSGTGNTLTTGNNPSTSIAVTPGFYYFYNPGAVNNITNGQWVRLTNNLDILSKTVSVSADTPSSPEDGYVYFDTDDNTFYRYNGTSWIAVSSSSGGSVPSAGPSDPSVTGTETLGDMYVNTNNNTIWVYNGSDWKELLTKVYTDGTTIDGEGTSVSVLTVKDGAITPVKISGITGNGSDGQILTSDGTGGFKWTNAGTVATTQPTSPETGDTYYDTTTNTYYVYDDDGTWHPVSGVTEVASGTVNQLTVANGTSTPELNIITGAVASGSTALATGDQINTFVTGQLGSKLDANTAITGNTKTKITYDSKGLVTAGADATTADIASGPDRRYVTDAQLTNIENLSGINTGDQDLTPYALKSNVLELTNTTSFTPGTDYEPATKKYVDDQISASGSGTLTSVTSATTDQLTVDNTTPAVPALNIVTGAVASGSTALATGDQINTFVTGQLGSKLDANTTITGDTKTKITYDSKGLVTAGADATTADIASSPGLRYVTDAQLANIENLSGTNTGDITLSGENYLFLSGQALTASPVNLSGSNATGTLAAARFPALTGDITNTAGSLSTSVSTNVIGTANLKGSSGALENGGGANYVLQSNGDGTFSWLNISSGVAADPSSLSLPTGQFYVGNASSKAAATAKNAIPLSGFGAAATALDLGSQQINNLTDPSSAQDAATKNYVDTKVPAFATADAGKILTINSAGDATEWADAGLSSVTTNTTLTGSGTSADPLGLASISPYTILGNNTGLSAIPTALTNTQAKSLLGLENVENTALSTWAGSSNITTLGTITSGTWNGDVISIDKGGTGATTASGALTALGGQPVDDDLTALAGLSTTGLIARTAEGTVATRTVTAGSGISVTNGDGVSGDPEIALATNAVGTSNLQGSSGALGDGNSGEVLQSNANGTFSWLDISAGLSLSPSSLNLTDETFLVGNSSGKAEETTKNAIPISGFGAAAAALDLGSQQINNLTDPSSAQDAATKNYVDTQLGARFPTYTIGDAGKVLAINSSGSGTEWADPGLSAVTTESPLSGDGTSSSPLGITDGGITLAKIQSLSAGSLLGRNSASAGPVGIISLGTGLNMSTGGTLSVSSTLNYSRTTNDATLSLPISSASATISAATNSFAGLMTASDKTKLDGIASSANNYSLPTASSSTLGGIKVGSNLTIAADGTLSAVGGGSGTVTEVSVADNDGITGTVTDSNTTPNIKLELGAITPTSVSTGDITSSGNITAAGNITATNIYGTVATAGNVSGIVAIANGGTSASDAATARINLGLGNVDNTSDLNKPISSLTQAALDDKIDVSEKGVASGVVPLNAGSKIDEIYLPSSLVGSVSFKGAYDATNNYPALPAASSDNTGYYYVASTAGTIYSITLEVGDWIMSNGSSWSKISRGSDVSSVFNRTGAVSAQAGDYNTDLVTEGSTNLYYTDARVDTRITGKEDVANKSNDLTTDATSTTKYPSVSAIKTYVDSKVPASTSSDEGKVLTVDATGIPGWEIPSNSAITLSGAVSGSGTNAITTTLGSNVVGTSNITDGSVTANDIAAQTILPTNLKGITANGTSGQALLSDGSGNFYWGSASGGATNLAYTPGAYDGLVTSDTGTDATIPGATTSEAGLMSSTDKTKLDKITDLAGSSDAGKVLTANSDGTAATWETPGSGGGTYLYYHPSGVTTAICRASGTGVTLVKTDTHEYTITVPGGVDLQYLRLWSTYTECGSQNFLDIYIVHESGLINNSTNDLVVPNIQLLNCVTETITNIVAAQGTAPFTIQGIGSGTLHLQQNTLSSYKSTWGFNVSLIW